MTAWRGRQMTATFGAAQSMICAGPPKMDDRLAARWAEHYRSSRPINAGPAMRDAAPKTIYLKDYTPFGFDIDRVDLTFDLAPSATRVTARIAFRPKPDARDKRFFLHGEDLKLIWAKIDGTAVTVRPVEGGIECDAPSIPFIWESEGQSDPAANTSLEGRYLSNGMYCTQCEAEGFRTAIRARRWRGARWTWRSMCGPGMNTNALSGWRH